MIRKRLLDLGLVLLSAPLILPLAALLALTVKLDSRGPVLFRQERVGRSGRPFTILKFRTMVKGAEHHGPSLTAHGDERITRVGRLLRRLKLDELPQLWNVLVGEMSLVGPRPEVPEYVALYPESIREKVLAVPPGITGDAALEFLDEEALLRSVENPEQYYVSTLLPRKLELYERYVDEWTLRSDIATLARTLLRLISPGHRTT